MDVVEALKARKSIRAFKPDPVPKDILREILEAAGWAPSAMNTQPWEYAVIAGDVLENVRKGNVEKLNSGVSPNPEHLVIGWPRDSVYRERQVDLAKQLFKLMDIPREDKEKRAQWMERGFRFFDAPAAIILLTDRTLSESGPLLDVGAVMQNICLAALNFGLGTCIEDQGSMYPDVLRKYVDIPESKRIIICIAIGYPDWDFPANKVETLRERVESITTWCGFE
ncbi:MAG: nitroreductase [Thermodesulfobacteriota bacterium]|nr:nitroreductase [Thermodesulfobacteriota bacterium]